MKIRAAGVNPVDTVIREGYYIDIIAHSFPVICGWELVGLVGERVHCSRRFGIGEEVCAYERRSEIQRGTFAEFIVIPECCLEYKPKEVELA